MRLTTRPSDKKTVARAYVVPRYLTLHSYYNIILIPIMLHVRSSVPIRNNLPPFTAYLYILLYCYTRHVSAELNKRRRHQKNSSSRRIRIFNNDKKKEKKWKYPLRQTSCFAIPIASDFVPARQLVRVVSMSEVRARDVVVAISFGAGLDFFFFFGTDIIITFYVPFVYRQRVVTPY